MGDDSALRGWLAGLPTTDSPDLALALVGALATRIAGRLEVAPPAALPAGRDALVDSAPPAALHPHVLGSAWEAITMPGERRRRGVHFTPLAVAEEICELAAARVQDSGRWIVWDPAVGGGAFLLAAAAVIERRTDIGRGAIVADLHGCEIDARTARIADAALELWSGVGVRPEIVIGDALVDAPVGPEGGFDLVVGNPPFLGQLTADTSRDADRRAKLAVRFGAAASRYVDEASLFLLGAVERCRRGGVVALLVPQSMLGAVDARAVRAAIAESNALGALWVESARSFDAAVDVAAPVIEKGGTITSTEVVSGGRRRVVATPDPNSWAPLLGSSLGVPSVRLSNERRLGELASATAGFRQHFYGISGAVAEQGESDDVREPCRLVTAGAIDPLHLRWGRVPTRFGGRTWARPVLHHSRIADEAVADWFDARHRPKVLVASQTRIVEVVADPDGSLMPSVPVISVESDEIDVWHLAALLTAPPVSAHLAAGSAGTGLGSNTIRIRAADLAEIPLPADDRVWAEGAALAERVQYAAATEDAAAYTDLLDELATVMVRAYGGEPDALCGWWRRGVRFPAPGRSGILEQPVA